MYNRVVITGIGINCCLGDNLGIVKENLLKNMCGIDDLDIIDTEVFSSHIGGEVNLKFDGQIEDRSLTLARTALKDALIDAKIDLFHGYEMSLLYGTCNGGLRSIENYNSIQEISKESIEQYVFNNNADKLAQEFNISGTVQTFNSACAASGGAICSGFDLIKFGQNQLVIAGGADAMSKAVYAGFNSLQSLAKTPCAPYDEKLGLSLGEGAAFLILENYEHAKKRKAKIYGEIKGYGLSNDCYHVTAPDPTGAGVEKSINMALGNSKIRKESISYINTHGTGTKANDAAELHAIRKVFGENETKRIEISSSKSYFGHTLGAAAVIEFATTILMLEEGYLPATLNHSKTRSGCEGFNLIFNEKKRKKDDYENILVNNSAFGGYNCSLIFSEQINSLLVDEPIRKVFINDFSFVSDNLIVSKNHASSKVDNGFNLKEYTPSLYKRRMNKLTQLAIGSLVNIKKIENFQVDPLDNSGLYIGTQFGSLESSAKYLTTIWEKGYDKASSIYFPDMVLNSTGGRLHAAFKIRGVAQSVSTGGNELLAVIKNAFIKLQNSNKEEEIFCCAGEEGSQFEDKIKSALFGTDSLFDSYFESIELSNTQSDESIFEVIEANQYFLKNQKRDILKLLLDKSDVVINISKSKYGREEIEKKIDFSDVEYWTKKKNVFEFLYKNYKNSSHKVLLLDITENSNLAYILLKGI
ncbi:3-oxoacyl-ACP synthase [Streptococcus mutans]|uniref:beta-ketoacyl-[acyl-carrier-protein] synthase family protein n=1 Tax=Streptococcus mutans TaxID=1309 RepID=UPI0002B59CD5|nr:beta-ketoacyl-[acyl-carrier-protein] synthase family protein [Streptococcus mutans]EMB78134.1 3-oxoacyl-(acyl-carrier-protein) synthase II [Streptococcus mutans 5SM3]EMB88775.1 3-oxoacyl-(acyl-carrier-protein) synthase II [Streptococcus mutans NMT4863]MCB4979418.1 beta-ketoacyl-[acyl-carrier-protein] synthase family protein [Streptococcus mutans]MCB5063736.1 beta-ketoacyl-[acyl-carrier-protein] synthase family protein [Streptococcus mutans]MDB8631215.1 beta-ketoacyl-[acyl-carrier-protein] s